MRKIIQVEEKEGQSGWFIILAAWPESHSKEING